MVLFGWKLNICPGGKLVVGLPPPMAILNKTDVASLSSDVSKAHPYRFKHVSVFVESKECTERNVEYMSGCRTASYQEFFLFKLSIDRIF